MSQDPAIDNYAAGAVLHVIMSHAKIRMEISTGIFQTEKLSLAHALRHLDAKVLVDVSATMFERR
jgi:hypothetical protein